MGKNGDGVGGDGMGREERFDCLTPEEFGELFTRYSVDLYTFARSIVHIREDARDVVSKTFLAAWLATLSLTPPFVRGADEQHRRHWLYKRAKWTALNMVRGPTIITFDPVDADDTDASARPLRYVEPMPIDNRIVERMVMDAALASLDPLQAACLVLSGQGFSRAEIADILGLTSNQVKRILPRAMERLRQVYFGEIADRAPRRDAEEGEEQGTDTDQ
jgi:RNA polymerase sigma factor (sigma-70 family)